MNVRQNTVVRKAAFSLGTLLFAQNVNGSSFESDNLYCISSSTCPYIAHILSSHQLESITVDRANPSVYSSAPVDLRNRLSQYISHLQLIKREGQTNILLSGISHHFRRDYTREQLNELNERAWGVGVERVRYTPQGHREGLSALGIRDSHSGLQLSMQYEFQYRVIHQPFVSAYLGLTAGLVARESFNYIPLPFVFPSATLRIGRVDFKSVYVPKIGAGVNRGAVLFLFASIAI